jgi:hypothetical protein
VRNKKQERREVRKYNGCGKEGKMEKEIRGHDQFFLSFSVAPSIIILPFQPEARRLCAMH